MFGFILGAVAGAVAAYMGHERIQQYMQKDVSAMRDRAAERLGDLGERAGSALDRARNSIESTVKTGQERLRTASSGGSTSSGTTHQSTGYDTTERSTRPGQTRTTGT